MKSKEVVGMLNLRRGMSLKRKTGVSLRHTATVIDYLNGGAPGIHHDNMNMMCSGIHRILHQLLNDRSRPLDHFTSRNLVGNGIRQKVDNVGHGI